MKTRFPSGALACVTAWGLALSAWGQSSAPPGDFRPFTNKEGRTIDAKIVSISPDRKTVKIRMRDGKEADLQAVLLSLDDQQYLKEWIASQPAGALAAARYRLEVKLEKFAGKPSDRERSSFYRYTMEYPAYRVRVTNLGRESAPGLSLEYILLTENETDIYKDGDFGWSYTSPSEDDTTGRASGVEKLPTLEYNREEVLTTAPLTLDSVLGDGNVTVEADKLLGAMVRIVDAEGTVIGLWRSQDAGVAGLNWEQAKSMAGGGSANDETAGMRRRSFEVTQGEMLKEDSLDITDKPFTVEARVLPDKTAPDGIIASHGAHLSGWALMVKGGKLIFLVRTDPDTVKELSVPLPQVAVEPFSVEAGLTRRVMRLEVAGMEPAETDSPGLIGKNPFEPLSVGFEAERPLTFGYEAPFKFAGTIEDFAIWIPRGFPGL